MLLLVLAATLVSLSQAVPPVWYNGPCGRSKYADAINQPLPPGQKMVVGGVEARSNEIPWQASIRRKSTNSHFCGGSIINSRYVVTASHCMSGETPAIVSVVIGDHTRNEANNPVRQTLNVERIWMHENYNPRTLVNDIALIKTVETIQFNAEIQPVCGPESTSTFAYQKCHSSGWGTLTSGGACCPQTLRYVTMNVTTNAYCDTAYPRDNITPDMICATDNTGSRDRDTCQGDSGGPLAVQNPDGTFALVGVVSWGIGCASGYPGVYARVGFFQTWILNIINNN